MKNKNKIEVFLTELIGMVLFQVKRVTGGQIRKTMSISNNEPLGALAVLFQHEHYLDCPVHEYLMTCEYYWHHVSLQFI